MTFKERYGPVALIAGASEGLGAAWAHALAEKGLDVLLIARRAAPLEQLAMELSKEFGIKATPIVCDLADVDALKQITATIGDTKVNFLVYNAALSLIGPFLHKDIDEQVKLAQVNMVTPLRLVHHFGKSMTNEGRGGMVLMSSLAGFQGSGFLATYAATKAFNRVLAEGLWYEWRDKGVDVLSCCAGATATPNYINSKPADLGFFAPKAQTPDAVVKECLGKLGKQPTYITGAGNRLASFFMHRFFSRKMAVTLMGDTTRKLYGIK